MIDLSEETFNIPIKKSGTKQSYYNRNDNDNFVENVIESLIVEKVRDYRKYNPGLGCAKLYLIIKDLFESTDCMPSRIAYIESLRNNELMVQIKSR